MRNKPNPAADLNSLFPYKVCINLDRRPERWQRMKERFAQHGITSVERFAATDGLTIDIPDAWPYTAGHYGCLQSHLAVLRLARQNNAANILIFEDDCVFDAEFGEKFPHFMSQLPDDWHLFFLGGKHFEDPTPVSENIAKAKMTYLAHAYVVNRSIYDVLIELCEQGQRALDDYTAELQKDFNCYCFMPDLIWQERLDSDTRPG
jgi:glycosyl transferase family 25